MSYRLFKSQACLSSVVMREQVHRLLECVLHNCVFYFQIYPRSIRELSVECTEHLLTF